MTQGFNISTFRSNINGSGVMRSNRFLVRIHVPVGMQKSPLLVGTAKYLEYWCEGVNIPGVSLATNEFRRYGYGNYEKKPYVAVTNEVEMSFISDAGGAIWTFFQQWIRMIVNFDMRNGINPAASNGVIAGQKPFEIAYKEEYISDIQILVFNDHSSTPELVIVLREAYPIFVGDIRLNWADVNTIARIPVSLTMYDWYNATLDFNNANTSSPIGVDVFDPRAGSLPLGSIPIATTNHPLSRPGFNR
jgi:hypothetical protein